MPKLTLVFIQFNVREFFPLKFQVLSTAIPNNEVLSAVDKKNCTTCPAFSKDALTHAVTFSSTGAS